MIVNVCVTPRTERSRRSISDVTSSARASEYPSGSVIAVTTLLVSAQTPEQLATGLMFRKTMGTNEGMLFIFDEPRQQCFWMKNTLLPLSVAFIADDGGVVNIDDMKPQTLDSHCSTKPVRFVLEMNVGWFDKRGIKAGSKFLGDPFKH